GSGGSASCGATVLGLIDLRSAFRPSPDPLGRVMLQPSLGTMTSCAAFVTGLMASKEPTTPLPPSLANSSMTSGVVAEPTATEFVTGSADAGAARPTATAPTSAATVPSVSAARQLLGNSRVILASPN